MSRIGRQPVPLPEGVRVSVAAGNQVTVQGPKGTLSRSLDPELTIRLQDGALWVQRPSDVRRHRAMHGLSRALLANMVQGVSEGFTKVLEVSRVGYRVQQVGGKLVLQVGFSHPVEVLPPQGIAFAVEGQNRVTVSGIDKELVGEVAARIRRVRPPEPYKGKGIRYAGEEVRRKAGKAGKAGGKRR